MYGGGGYAKASLARYRKFDFGNCMIGKDTSSFLPIKNEGSAILHLIKFQIKDTDTFFRGEGWPSERVSLFPGSSYQLPLVFNPHEEHPDPGKLIIGTNGEKFEISLIGYGREAVLIVSKMALEFSDCIVGNSYEQTFTLKNIGDVNYPLSFDLEKKFTDVEFRPASLLIGPFSESSVTAIYKPSHETKSTVVLTISSPYSMHKVPIQLHSGYCSLKFNAKILDFGMFERTTKPSVTLSIKNDGSVKSSFHVNGLTKPAVFHISPHKGLLLPGKSIDVTVTHILHEVSQFNEKLHIRSDLVNRLYSVLVKGNCEETILNSDFTNMNMGPCPILETTTKQLSFTNHGNFPCDFQMKSFYPLKVTPVNGVVLGHETGTVNVLWNPSGSYELRSQIQMITNIGNFVITVRGKAMLPDLTVSANYLDFGVCAIGYTYSETIQLENRGKVPLRFSIPSAKDPSFVSSIKSGVLQPKELVTMSVLFTPTIVGKVTSSMFVECKGVQTKEIGMNGMGGSKKLKIDPKSLILDLRPVGVQFTETIIMKNEGNVPLHLNFFKTLEVQDNVICNVPEPFTLEPNFTKRCQIGLFMPDEGQFFAELTVSSKEHEVKIVVQGSVILMLGTANILKLSKRSRDILENESFNSLQIVGPLMNFETIDPLEACKKRFDKGYLMDIEICSAISNFSVMRSQDTELHKQVDHIDNVRNLNELEPGRPSRKQENMKKKCDLIIYIQKSTPAEKFDQTVEFRKKVQNI